jgi:zinc protease
MNNIKQNPAARTLCFCISDLRTRNYLFRYLLLILFFQFTPVTAQPLSPIVEVEGVSEYRLTNGLRILLMPDSAKAVTTVNLTVLSGSSDEDYGETGMAHLLEHLVFKGSTNFPEPKEEMTRRGLLWNGTTSEDRTNYFASFSASDDTLGWYLKWVADALVNARIDKKDLDIEMTVVRNELERGENNAEYMLLQKMQSAAFQWHNYGKPVIGARSDVENVNIERLRNFYHLHYQPDNAVLIVTGKFNTSKTLEWIQASFGKIPKPSSQVLQHYTIDASQDGEHQVTVRRTGEIPMVGALYHIPPAAHPDYAAMALIASIMGSEPEGRLYKVLSTKKLAASTLGWAVQKKDPGYIIFGARLTSDMSVDATRTSFLDVLDSISEQPISPLEMEHAKLRWRSAFEQQLADPEKMSTALSEASAIGDWRLMFLIRDHIQAVKLDEIRQAAKRWLLPVNRTIGVYIPTEKPVRAPEPKFINASQQLDLYQGGTKLAEVKEFDPAPEHLDAAIQTFQLANGMKIALLPKDSRGGKVHVMFTMRYGNERMLVSKQAAALLTRAMLERGTKDMSRIGLAFKALSLGLSNFHVNAGKNFFSFDFDASGEKLKEAVPLMAKVLREPLFPADEFEKLKIELVANLERQRNQPDAVAGLNLERTVNPFTPDNIRFIRDLDQQIAEIKATSLDQLVNFHKEFFGTSHAELAIVGTFDAALARTELSSAFSTWNALQPYERIHFDYQPVAPQAVELRTPDMKSATFMADLSFSMDEDHPDYPVVLVANRILGGGFGGRLVHRVREQDGLSYSVSSWLLVRAFDNSAHWRIYASFAPENRLKLEQGIFEELSKLEKAGVSQNEVTDSVKGLLEQMKRDRSEDSSLSVLMARNLWTDRSFNWYLNFEENLRKVKAEDVNRVLVQLLQEQKWTRVIAGDFPSAK